MRAALSYLELSSLTYEKKSRIKHVKPELLVSVQRMYEY